MNELLKGIVNKCYRTHKKREGANIARKKLCKEYNQIFFSNGLDLSKVPIWGVVRTESIIKKAKCLWIVIK